MKNSLVLSVVILLLIVIPAGAQLGGLMNKVKNSVANEITGNKKSEPAKIPEPACACDPAELILDLGGKLQLAYGEVDISSREDGALLIKDKITGNFYIAHGGVTEGPYQAGDKKLTGFEEFDSGASGADDWISRFGQYISKSGNRYMIKFAGKSYGPYDQIRNFDVTKSKDKFAATVIETVAITEDDGERMEEAMKKAKTDQEKMELAMQFSQQMQQRMMAGGGPETTTPRLITNIPGVTYNPMMGGVINSKMKYDDLLYVTFDGVKDLMDKNVITINPEHAQSKAVFISSNNNKYAWYNYGELNISDNKTYADLFNPQLVKGADGKIYLAYMYYSPAKNAIMQCKILF